MSDQKAYFDFTVNAVDKEGEVVSTESIEDAGKITIGSVFDAAVLHRVDTFEINVSRITFKTDGEIDQRYELDEA